MLRPRETFLHKNVEKTRCGRPKLHICDTICTICAIVTCQNVSKTPPPGGGPKKGSKTVKNGHF